MKTTISKLNTYLLEHHPTLWNTRVVWMLLISLIIHFFFFIIGLLALSNPEVLHERRAVDLFFDNGLVYFGIIISVIMIVLWLMFLFKNNAFKSFYPNSRFKLFLQFLIYVVIIFFSTTFYFSYTIGLKLYISNTYTNDVLKSEITTANNAAVFFSHSLSSYTISSRKYPKPFDSLYCETNRDLMDKDAPIFNFLNNDYQFYSLRKEIVNQNNNELYYYDRSMEDHIYTVNQDSITTYFFKDSVMNIKKYVKSFEPSFYNHSYIFYSPEIDVPLYEFYDEFYGEIPESLNERVLRNQLNHELLNRNDPQEIKQLLNDFLNILKTYKVKHNISANQWYDLIYHPKDFKIRFFIRNTKPRLLYNDYDHFAGTRTASEEFVYNNTLNYYMETPTLRNVFENIEEVKSKNIFEGTIHFYLWIAFLLSSIIFVYRVTGLKTFLFSIITIGVLLTLTALFAAVIDQTYSSNVVTYFVEYFIFVIASVILAVPLFFMHKLKKSIVAVCVSISIQSFVFYVFLIVGIISTHQRDYCRQFIKEERENCFILIEYLDVYTSYLLLVIGFIFVFFYSSIIKKWKALPEY